MTNLCFVPAVDELRPGAAHTRSVALEVRGGQPCVQVGDLEVHRPLGQKVLTLLVPATTKAKFYISLLVISRHDWLVGSAERLVNW